MIDVGAAGTTITILALQSFPMGFQVKHFADDVDPLIIEEVEPFGYDLLYDGGIFAYDKAAVSKVSISVVAGSSDDTNLKILLQTRKGNKSLLPIEDRLTMTISYPSGMSVFTDGTILKGPLADGIAQTARKKSNTYTFVFASFAGLQNNVQRLATAAQTLLNFV